jgi:hypothetical protein
MIRHWPHGLKALVILLTFSSTVSAEVYFCKESATVSIDPYNISSSGEDGDVPSRQDWIVDTERGWRRSGFPDYRGACQKNKGYVVCRTDNIAFGEATLSIHPNDSNFVVVYLDYGLGALAFVGKCSSN